MGIPTTSHDMEALLIAGLSSVEQTFNIRPDKAKPYRLLTVVASLGVKVTPISRYCQVTVAGWSVTTDGRADIGDAFDLAAEAGRWLETNTAGVILSADIQAGPFRVQDPVSKIENQTVTVLLEVAV